MKLKKLLLGTFTTIALCTTFASCTKNEDTPNDDNSKIELPSKRAYILYEGPSGYNKSGIAFYAPNKDADFQNDIFSATKLLQKSEMRKVIVIELSYKGFS